MFIFKVKSFRNKALERPFNRKIKATDGLNIFLESLTAISPVLTFKAESCFDKRLSKAFYILVQIINSHSFSYASEDKIKFLLNGLQLNQDVMFIAC